MSLVQGAQHGIAFTSLGLDPVLLQMGPFALRWYSMAYLAGIVLGWLYHIRLSQDEDSPLGRSDADELITWATVGIIAGGRLAYVLFYEPAAYLAVPTPPTPADLGYTA